MLLDVVIWVAAVAVGYLVGALPSGVIVARLWRGIDIRNYGSGATGATNVYRTLGRLPAGLTLGIDFAKGAVPVLTARLLASWLDVAGSQELQATVGVAAVVGHTWPLYVQFKGGKGIATGWGALTAMSPIAAATGLVGLAIIGGTRYVSLGALGGAGVTLLATVVLAVWFGWPYAHVVYTAVGCGLIFFRHWGNIGRLITGTERQFEAEPRPERADSPQRHPSRN